MYFTLPKSNKFEPENRPGPKRKPVTIPTIYSQVRTPSFREGTPRKINMEPGNTMEYTPALGKSSSKPSFWGSMLIFGGVIPEYVYLTIDQIQVINTNRWKDDASGARVSLFPQISPRIRIASTVEAFRERTTQFFSSIEPQKKPLKVDPWISCLFFCCDNLYNWSKKIESI